MLRKKSLVKCTSLKISVSEECVCRIVPGMGVSGVPRQGDKKIGVGESGEIKTSRSSCLVDIHKNTGTTSCSPPQTVFSNITPLEV